MTDTFSCCFYLAMAPSHPEGGGGTSSEVTELIRDMKDSSPMAESGCTSGELEVDTGVSLSGA